MSTCVLFLLSSLVVSNQLYPTSKIINGHIASEMQIPYQVSLQKAAMGKWKHICGGAIIGKFWVLTAAHCLTLKWIRYRVVVGSIYLDKKDPQKQILEVFDTFIHPGYPNEEDVKAKPFDIGLLKLVHPFVFNEYVQPVNLPVNTTDCIRLEEGMISGWGMILWWLPIPSSKLRFSHVQVIPHQRKGFFKGRLLDRPCQLEPFASQVQAGRECRDLIIEKVGGPVIFDKTMVCTLHSKETFCNGDSGSPLVQKDFLGDEQQFKYKVYGVASFGDSPCGFANTPDVYTSVCVFINWINEIINQ